MRPLAIALCGISGLSGPDPSWVCAMVMPPRSLITLTPRVPSESPPDITMPTAFSPWSCASEAKNTSIGLRSRSDGSSFFRCTRPPAIVRILPSGMIWMTFGRTSAPSSATTTGIEV